MTLEKCKSCESHILYQDGYVLCNFWKKTEQRITGSGEDGTITIVSCPQEETSGDYKKIFPARWNKTK